jgi:hypothetical protein
MSDRVDQAWEKAAACEAHAQATADSKVKLMFVKLRESWIRIANNAQLQNDLKGTPAGSVPRTRIPGRRLGSVGRNSRLR